MGFPGGQRGHRMTLKAALHGTLPEGTVSQGSRLALSWLPQKIICLCICAGHHKHLQSISVFPGTVAHKQSNWQICEVDCFPLMPPASLFASLFKTKTSVDTTLQSSPLPDHETETLLSIKL